MALEERWQAIANQIQVERDPNKVIVLAEELLRVLDERRDSVKPTAAPRRTAEDSVSVLRVKQPREVEEAGK